MKDIIDTIKDTDSRLVSNYIATFLSTIAPGILIIYMYKPSLFLQLETIKFILFALSLSLPLWTINIFILGPPRKDEGTTSFIVVVFLASMAASFSYYVSLLICYIFKLPFLWFISISAVSNIILLFFIRRLFLKYNTALNSAAVKDAAPVS